MADRRLGRPGPLDQDPADVRRRRRLRGRQLRRPQLPLRHPRARHGRDRSTAWRWPRSARTAPTFFIFSDYARAVDPAGGDHGDSRSSTSSRTTRSASARTARRTSRSSSWPRCGPFPASWSSGPADANEVVEAWKVIMPLQHEPAVLVLTRQAAADARPHQVRPGLGPGPRRLRPGRRSGRQAGGDPDRHRQRGGAVRRRVRGAHGGGDRRPGGNHAVLGAVRAPGPGVSRPGAAPGGARTGHRGGGLHVRLVPVCGTGGAILGMETFGASRPSSRSRPNSASSPAM